MILFGKGCGKGNSGSLERLQRRAAKMIHPNSGLDTYDIFPTLKLIPVYVRVKIHSLIIVRQCLDSAVPPHLLNYFKLNESRTLGKTKNIWDITLSKVRLEVTKRAFYCIGAVQFNKFQVI